MIQEDIGIGEIVITDTDFGAVSVGDKTFLDRWLMRYDEAPEQLVWMNQVHSATVKRVDDKPAAVRIFDDTDGVWTDQAGIMLITKTADCVPILLWNEDAGVIAALHAGWKGFAKGIIEAFCEQMRTAGFSLEDFSVFLGPHLRVENFQVQQDFIDALPEEKREYLREIDGQQHYDISEGVKETLLKEGIVDCTDCGIDSYTSPDFFSYRQWCHLPEDQRSESYSTFANTIILQ